MSCAILGPLVTVIVPAFNAELVLAQTLLSVAAQDHRNLEILIVDDGSTDKTAQVADDFCSTEPRARLLRKPNGGVASARNHALAEARGEFVAPIDADDLWHPAKISRQVAAARRAPGTGFVYCWFRDIDSDGRVWRDGPSLTVQGRALQRLAYFNFVGNGSAPLFSRQALESVGGYDERLRRLGAEGCEDLLVQLAVAKRYGVAVVPQYLVGYRLTSGSMSGDAHRMHRSWRHALELARRGAAAFRGGRPLERGRPASPHRRDPRLARGAGAGPPDALPRRAAGPGCGRGCTYCAARRALSAAGLPRRGRNVASSTIMTRATPSP